MDHLKTGSNRSKLFICALVGAAVLLYCSPSIVVGFSLLGGSLSTSSNNYQRDVRVFNNFLDSNANDNQIPDDDYPGALGAPLAVWKAAVAWNSNTGGALRNFDYDWQGEATAIGGRNDNTVSSLQSGCGGSTLAFAEGPISNGWRIRFCDNRLWDDGPGSVSGVDLQGVAVHELGHTLGLGHSNQGCGGNCFGRPVMCSTICGDGISERGLKPDDQNGLEFIYGSIPSTKPVITGISGTMSTGATIVVDGVNFASSVNVKFTAGTSRNSGSISGVRFGVSSTNGGTRVQVTIPSAARTGNVFVWQPGNGGLSNYFPIFIDETPPSIFTVDPTEGPIRGGTEITIVGSFALNASVQLDGVQVDILSRSESEVVVDTLPGGFVGEAIDVSVHQGSGVATIASGFTYVENPIRLEWSGFPNPGSDITISVYGPRNKDVAVAVGAPGETERIGITFCVEAPFVFVKKFSAGLNTGSLGRVDTVWEGVVGDIFQTWHIIGVLKDGPGSFEDLGCNPLTVLP